jgi:hypothetical protein
MNELVLNVLAVQCVFLSGKSDKAFFIEMDSKRVIGCDKDVESKVIFESF